MPRTNLDGWPGRPETERKSFTAGYAAYMPAEFNSRKSGETERERELRGKGEGKRVVVGVWWGLA